MNASDAPQLSRLAALEALLFISGEPLPVGKITTYLDIGKGECEALLEELRVRLEGDADRGISLLVNGGVVMLLTKPQTAPLVERLTTETLRENLSRAALEVLAIIAYRGPISRAGIDMIRGVNSSYTLRNLLLRGLIEREDERQGRGFLYAPSLRFLQTVGVNGLSDLPDFASLSSDTNIAALIASADLPPAGEAARGVDPDAI